MGLDDVADIAVGINDDVGDAVDVEAHGATRRYWSDHCVGDYLSGHEVEV